ncbi:M48 family metalloprotease [Flaviramulus sp. BrNp1-15]|uniref:M48 family metalloprotease n=1 Tax=Flaviramulus sp. BrNp1-15 TaxID=2916754 RepID=UPI001EE7C958|nr:M48 family metalloprotease [Flaviramulus sp. BrNp1-15]ULC59261.1 M48 family metalloprotease [Flaviramulus sp. BrNp1-15]
MKKINQNQINKIDGQFSSKIKKLYKDRDEKVVESIEDSVYIFNSEIKNHLNKVLQQVYSSNPEINSNDFYFFIKNSIVPNAACYGDGMFEIYLGLFTKLDSEDELAFIICHEIAHKLLNHSLNSISKKVASVNSKETKQKIRSLKRMEYGQTRAALSVIDELNIDFLDHSKEVEAQADSLGFLLYSKTKYNIYSALSSLEKLEKVDEMILHHDVKLDSVFNFEGYPFQSYWLKENTSLFDTTEEINEFSLVSDTLKTHPEIEFRVNKLIKDFNLESNNIDIEEYITKFKSLKQISHLHSIEFTLDLKLLDVAIYQLIEKFNNKEIDEGYYYTKMAKALRLIYEVKKNHELGKYVPFKSRFSDEKQLNVIRLFLHNLELNEVEKIGLAFCAVIESKKINNPDFNDTIEFFKSINN